MTVITRDSLDSDEGPDWYWLRAIDGDKGDTGLWTAFLWKSTPEGHSYWESIAESAEPMSEEIKEKIKLMYVEWKLTGDIDDRDE